MHLDEAIQLFLDHRRQRSVGTRRHYRRWLTEWRDWRLAHSLSSDLESVLIDDFRNFLHYLEFEHVPYLRSSHRRPATKRGLKPASVAAARRTLRAFWHFLDYEEVLSAKQGRFFGNNRIPAPIVSEPPRPYCDEHTLHRLLDACGDGFDEESARNRAILFLLYESGMRVGELCALEDAYTDLRHRQALVLGKGNEWRPVFWQPPGVVALIRYVLLRRGPRAGGCLFRGTSHRNNGGQLTPDTIRALVKRIAAAAGIALPPGCPLHWFRHSFAKRCLKAGAEDSVISQFLGHHNPKTTARYTKEYPDRLKAKYDAMFCPTVIPQSKPERLRRRT